MSIPEEWWRLDAVGQAELVREGVATPLELVEVAIERIEVLDPAVNAVITPLYEEGRQIASELADAGQPFRGVPILLKDAGEELEGTPYYLGTAVLRDIGYRSTRTTEFVRRLLDAGFVPIGKTNLPELSSGLTTEPRAFGPTPNPFGPRTEQWWLERGFGGCGGGWSGCDRDGGRCDGLAAGAGGALRGSDAASDARSGADGESGGAPERCVVWVRAFAVDARSGGGVRARCRSADEGGSGERGASSPTVGP